MMGHRRLLLSMILMILLSLIYSILDSIDGFTQEDLSLPASNPSALLSIDKIYLPLVHSDFPATTAPSYYISELSKVHRNETDIFYSLGYALGGHDQVTLGVQNNLVILDYGYPFKSGSTYGVHLVMGEVGTFFSTNKVIDSAYNFARGYYNATGSDHDSHLRMVIGVNNCCTNVSLSTYQGHGTAWGQTVNSIRSQITPYSTQVDVVAGCDIETWGNSYPTEQWLNNYMAASTCVPGSNNSADGCFYNFGNMTISVSGTSCATGESSPWQACDVWYLSWGAQKNGKRFARPLPEIYVRLNLIHPQWPWGENATVWKDLSLFSANQMGAGKMYFVGSLTQRGKCGEGCAQGNNYPWEGYGLLRDALASNPTTAMSLRWSTDITIQPTSTP